MSNSIGPCPTELDTLDSNIGAGSRWSEGYRSHSKAPSSRSGCVAHGSGTTHTRKPTFARALTENVLKTPFPCAHAQSITWTRRYNRPPLCARAQTVGSHPAQHVRSRGANRQHEQDRDAGRLATYLKQRDRVVPSKDWICRLRSHLHTQHEQQFE